ncbi:ADP-ribosylation factor 1 [Histomonas meleagridis]|uniref:ADP-ribosylation factor 1 n=1 Tax=Histomonas meleagridis TaxID=135588 RepID=UPI0035597E6A|nr:ADP-ribosylation factor 1 [Histomonas meleagridis]KAH0805325.1 ADP-ribosylation factor 1 [Histomonas meleagridis]
MGSFLSGACKDSGNQKIKIFVMGTNGSGKTKLLCKLMNAENLPTIPTIGFNIQTVKYKTLQLEMWDTGGNNREMFFDTLYRQYFHDTQGIIFVVDSNDTTSLDDARDELQKLLKEDELRETSLLIYANKQDLPDAVQPDKLVARLGLAEVKNRKWFMTKACAITGDGLQSGLEWLEQQINHKK